jgi:hypothetical protein
MGPRLTREFDTALGELRIRALSQGLPEASAGEAVAAQVNGCSVRQVLLRGFAIRLARLKYERSLLRASLETPEKRGPMPGDQAPASCLAELHARQRARLGALALEIDAARRRLASAAGPDTDGPAGPDQSQAPVPLPAASRKDS